MNKRIEWIDSAKFIGIFFVVFGHTTIPEPLKTYIYSFHMPFFFFLSGLFFNSSLDFKGLLKSKAKSIVIPYFVFSFISYGYWFLTRGLSQTNSGISPFEIFLSIFYGTASQNLLICNTPLWFFTCLFMVNILFFLLAKNKNFKKITIGLLIFSVAGYLDMILPHTKLPWSIDAALTGVVFFGLGFLLKNFIFGEKFNNIKTFLLIPVFFLLQILFSTLNGRIDMTSGLGNYFYFYAAALSGIFFWLIVAKKMQTNKIISFFGKNTMVIFSLQIIVFSLITGFFNYILNFPISLNYQKLITINPDINPNTVAIIYTALTFVVIAPLINIVNKLFFKYNESNKKEKDL